MGWEVKEQTGKTFFGYLRHGGKELGICGMDMSTKLALHWGSKFCLCFSIFEVLADLLSCYGPIAIGSDHSYLLISTR